MISRKSLFEGQLITNPDYADVFEKKEKLCNWRSVVGRFTRSGETTRTPRPASPPPWMARWNETRTAKKCVIL